MSAAQDGAAGDPAGKSFTKSSAPELHVGCGITAIDREANDLRQICVIEGCGNTEPVAPRLDQAFRRGRARGKRFVIRQRRNERLGDGRAGECECLANAAARLPLGHRHLGLSDRRRLAGRRQRRVHLGQVHPHARQNKEHGHGRYRARSLPSLQGRRAVDEGAAGKGVSIFDLLAAHISQRHRRSQSEGLGLLRPFGGRVAR